MSKNKESPMVSREIYNVNAALFIGFYDVKDDKREQSYIVRGIYSEAIFLKEHIIASVHD